MILLSSFFVSLINMLTVHALLTRKKSFFHCLATFILNTVFVFSAVYLVQKYITQSALLKYTIYFVAFMYIIYIHIIFKESISKKIFTMFSIWMFSTSALILVTSLSGSVSGIIAEKNIPDLVFLTRICLQVLFLPVAYLWLSKPYKKVLDIVPDKTINIMSFYPIIAFLLQINTFGTSFGPIKNFESIYDTGLLIVFINLGYILVFAGIYSSSKTISLQYNYKIIENQVELQRQNYKTLNESLKQLYMVKHDIRHHISTIKTMVYEKKNKQVLEYIEQFNQNELSKTIPTLCNNFAADSIIKYYMSLALSKNIDFKTDLNIPEDIGINSLDLCVVLGNSLENAVEACDKLSTGEVKYIQLISKIVDTHIVFKIINNFNGEIEKSYNIIRSSKGGNSSGIGLSSISETVNKYNGKLDLKYTDNMFEVTIIMCTGMSINAIS